MAVDERGQAEDPGGADGGACGEDGGLVDEIEAWDERLRTMADAMIDDGDSDEWEDDDGE